MRKLPHVLMLLLAATPVLFASNGHAACGPADIDFSVAPALPAVPIAIAMDDDRVLLGKRGERVPTHRKLAWIDDTGDLMPRTWADKVDWSAYRASGKTASAAPTKLYFAPDGRLCRVERYRALRGQAVLDGGFALSYDTAGALAAYIEYQREYQRDYQQTDASRAQPYTATRRACLQRDAKGQLTAFIDDGCGEAQGVGPSRQYVRDPSGRLLRVIDKVSSEQPVAVQTVDAQGKPGPRYVRQSTNYHAPGVNLALTAYPAPPGKPSDRLFPLHREVLAALPVEVPENPWRVVKIKDDVPLDDDMMSWDPDTQIVLAEGAQGTPNGAALTPVQQKQVWQAMGEHPGRVFFYPDPMTRVMLLPAMPPEKWKACSDPGNRAADACAG
ncbi:MULTISPECIES: hypothetical protein [Achromobacter]|uniref:Uncharacterized protein n=1 Tax=Achromobacter spanius TaxID=217203 RepID=A0ABY8GVE6_9BURK|nr:MULTISPECIES: hypothetical protein [Achromobacter]WAI82058.1 hypothetical protein N8Z00_21345 [Achromobacter spanius]WEX92146.1 hypothetical protein N3Z32_15955 [Achromobacter sp. SS2-2022]WFP08707.1 hypothetical protein P8T11_02175 [Achromobacter spanius]